MAWLLLPVIVIGLAWWGMPAIVAAVASRLASASGWSIEHMEIPRQLAPPWRVPRLTLAVGDTRVTAQNLQIFPPGTHGEWRFRITTLDITSTANSDPTPTLTQIRRRIADNLPLPATSGSIEQLNWCDDSCTRGNLTWRTAGTWFDMDARIESRTPIDVNIAMKDAEVKITSWWSGLYSATSIKWPANGDLKWTSLVHLHAQTGSLQLSGDQPLHFDADVHQLTLSATGSIPDSTPITPAALLAHTTAMVDGRAVLDATAKFGNLSVSNESSNEIAGHIQVSAEGQSLTLASPLSLHIQSGDQSPIRVNLDPSSQCTSVSGNVDCKLMGPKVTGISLDKQMLEANAKTARISGNAQSVSLSSNSAALLGLSNIQANVDLAIPDRKVRVSAQWHGSTGQLKELASRLGIGDLQIHTGDINTRVSTGLNLSAATPSEQLMDTSVTVTAKHLGFTWNGYAFIDGTLDLALQGWPTLNSSSPARMDWQEINIGVPVTQVSSRLNVTAHPLQDDYLVQGVTFTGKTLGGTLASNKFDLTLPAINGHALVEIDGIQLNQILALEKQSFESTGRISGSVPVQLSDGKLSVQGGRLAALAPGGLISVKRNEAIDRMVQDNEQMKSVIDALSDFRYHSLESRLDYSSEGKLVAHTALQGNNPGFENGREIHFNLQLEENVGTLLESLRLSDTVTGRIEEKLRAGAKVGK